MHSYIKDRLPDAVKSLVDKLESLSGNEIKFVKSEKMVKRGLMLNISETEASIWFGAHEQLTPHAITHELLHVDRFWCLPAPQLGIKGQREKQHSLLSQVTNCLEHLVIVPRELEHGFDGFAMRTTELRRTWDEYPWPEWKDPMYRRIKLLVEWISTDFLTNDCEVRESARAALKTEGLYADAVNFSKKLRQIGSSPEAAMSTARRFMKVTVPCEFLYFDIRHRTKRYVDMPEH